jgi:acyl-coenzyme A thioesterase PaaI-like protein
MEFVPMADPITMLQTTWNGLKNLPGGGLIFGRLVGRLAPYTGTIKPEVLELRRGYGKVKMKDRKKVRNHLDSIHAIALMNLAEASSGLAFTYSMPKRTRAILTGLEIEYLKKARGTLTAECHCPILETNERATYELEVVTHDEAGDVVTRAKAHWLVGPQK